MLVVICKGEGEMAISKDFRDAVSEEKRIRVKIMLKDSLLLDKTFKAFEEMLAYAKTNMPDLIEEHDGEVFKTSELWNEEYLNEQMVMVMSNFSSERLNLIKKIIKQIYPQIQERTEVIKEEVPNAKTESSNKSHGAYLGIVCAGIVLLFIGIAVSGVPIIVPIIGGVMIGSGAYFLLKQ